MDKENLSETKDGVSNGSCPPVTSEDVASYQSYSSDKESGLPTCRVCQCAESDRRGDAALGFLGIIPPVQSTPKTIAGEAHDKTEVLAGEENSSHDMKNGTESKFVEFISPGGEVFICSTDLEVGSWQYRDSLVELGCSCKNDLAVVHYACALKWFVNHGSTVCEICGHVAENIRTADFRKVVVSLKDYEALRERTAGGDPIPLQVNASSRVDPVAVAAIRRQRLSEISSWFGPHNNSAINNTSGTPSQVISEQPTNAVNEAAAPTESRATRWAVEGTGILLATGLLTVTLAWLIAPRVGKKTARSGLHILLGGLCALTVVVFFRFVVLTRIRYGPARYWAILFVFWFLVFGIWASRTHSAHQT